MPTCEHCGEDFPKGGAYATHVRYCNARPDEDQSSEEDSVTHESGGDGLEEGVDTKGSAHAPMPQSDQVEIDVGTEGDTSESRGTGEQTGNEATLSTEHTNPENQSSRGWVAAIVLMLVFLIVWRSLSRTEH